MPCLFRWNYPQKVGREKRKGFGWFVPSSMTDLKKQPMSTYTFAPSSAYALSTHEVKIDKDRSRRPHLHELPAPPEAQGLKWLTEDLGLMTALEKGQRQRGSEHNQLERIRGQPLRP